MLLTACICRAKGVGLGGGSAISGASVVAGLNLRQAAFDMPRNQVNGEIAVQRIRFHLSVPWR
jgi:hypothetical protein